MATSRVSSGPRSYDYERTMMGGVYTQQLADFAQSQGGGKFDSLGVGTDSRRRSSSTKREGHGNKESSSSSYIQNFCTEHCMFLRRLTEKLGEDWVFLALLGFIMALLSYGMDYGIEKTLEAHRWMYDAVGGIGPAMQFFVWVSFPVVLIIFSTGFVHIVAPNAIGSGIPEMKTILRGIVLKEYLTFRTLISKVIGLMASLGSGLPFGKEGPFVHIASIVATLLGKGVTSFRGIYENESRNSEMLAAACATGVACTFAAPIGGVLFSIEVTATSFAVRNYWRGFFSAVCAALVFRILAIVAADEDTLIALFKTQLREEFPFDVVELLGFAFIGVTAGLAGALFVYYHRWIINFNRNQKRMAIFLTKHRLVYPFAVALFISCLTCPLSLGRYMASKLTLRTAINQLFSNFSFTDPMNEELNFREQAVIANWSTDANLFVTLTVFMLFVFFMSPLAITLPVPSGVFIPVFAIGAAFGRLIGEAMFLWFPQGVSFGGHIYQIIPGGYAIVGAAAMSGAVTHTISTAMIVFELTGQISHILPAVLAVLLSNAVAHSLQPSIYDSTIQIKRLPYLPNYLPANANAHKIFAEDIMKKDLITVSRNCLYNDIRKLLFDNPFIRSFPLVEDHGSMILLGSIQRSELLAMLDRVMAKKQGMAMARILAESLHHTQQKGSTPGSRSPSVSAPKEVVDVTDKSGGNLNRLLGLFKPHSSHDSMATSDSDLDREDDGERERQDKWENEQMRKPADFTDCRIDPAPFQLVEKTSLYKIHSIFSLLDLNHAYVTNIGRLVGIVSIKELREEISGPLVVETKPPAIRAKRVSESSTIGGGKEASHYMMPSEDPREFGRLLSNRS